MKLDTYDMENMKNPTFTIFISALLGIILRHDKKLLKTTKNTKLDGVDPVDRVQTDYERYTWKGATYAIPNTKHSLPNME